MTDGGEHARRQIVEELPQTGIDYLTFLADELDATRDSRMIVGRVQHPAPPDLSSDHLEAIAESLRQAGWKADVAHMMEDDQDSPLSVRIILKEL